MATRWGVDDLKGDNSPLHGYEWNHLARCSTAQTQGALRAIGAGVVEGFTLTPGSGLEVDVAAGHAIVESVTHGYVWLASGAAVVQGLADDGDNYLFAALEIAEIPDAPDSRAGGYTNFVVQTDDTLDGAVLLAQITCADGAVTAVVDRRTLREGGGLLADLFDAGRVVGADTAVGAPEAAEDDETCVALPAGGKWYVAGRRFHLQAPVLLDTPANKPAGVFGFLGVDPETDELAVLHWYDSYPTGGALVALRAQGLPCLGAVKTEGENVTGVDATVATGHADLVYTQAGLLARIAEAGAGGEGGVDPDGKFATREAYDDLAARVTALENAAGASDDVALLDDTEADRALTQQLATYQVRHDPNLARYLELSIPSPRYSGMGQITGDGTALPDVRAGGNANLDAGNDEIS